MDFGNNVYIKVMRSDMAQESKGEGSMNPHRTGCKAIGNGDSSRISCG